jgi:hypothetical protein
MYYNENVSVFIITFFEIKVKIIKAVYGEEK